MKTDRIVREDRKISGQVREIDRRVNELKRRIKQGALQYDHVIAELQLIVQNQKPADLEIVTVPFDPVSFLGEGWGEIPEERDEESAKFVKVDLGKADFVSCLKEGEVSIDGKEKLQRLKENRVIRFGSTVFMGLLDDYQLNKDKSVLEKLFRAGVIGGYLDFFGNIFLAKNGSRFVLSLCRNGNGKWFRVLNRFDTVWGTKALSAVSLHKLSTFNLL